MLLAALVLPLLLAIAIAPGASPPLATTLPLVVIDADAPIDRGPKVGASMRIIDTPGGPNRVGDAPNAYSGRIRIEVRGQSSARFPKKSFALETVDERGKNRNVRLLGMPKENDWILYAGYNDGTLLRNVVAYSAARKTGRYAARTRHVEVVLNGRYWGVYVLMEKLKLDKARVTSPVKGSKGYLLEFTHPTKIGRKDVLFRTPVTRTPSVFAHPKGQALSPAERNAIARRVAAYERALYGRAYRHPRNGYRRHLDMPAAVDYALVNEFLANRDAFQASTFIHQGRGGRLAMGPVWDFDLSMGHRVRTSPPQGCMLCARRWAARWYNDPAFVRAMTARWAQLRRQGFVDGLVAEVRRDARALEAAQVRNLRRWPKMGTTPVSPTISDGVLGQTYLAEAARLERWLRAREAWMTANLPRIGRL